MYLKTFIIGVGTGLIAGAATVLLTTPQSGKDLKISLKDRKDGVDSLKVEFQERIQSIKQSIDTIKSEIQETVPSVIEDVKLSVSKFQEDSAPNQQQLQIHLADLQKSAEEISAEIEALQKSK